jgi:outer membrane immunogenic protein
MKWRLLACAAAVAFSSAPALAQSPAAPTFDWSGFYVGANAGLGWGRSVWTDTIGGFFTDVPGRQFSTRPLGALAGGQVGYNWQARQSMLGVELSGAFSSMDDSIVSPFFSVDTVRTRVASLWSAAAKLGFAIDRSLFYLKGGYASALINANIDSPNTFFAVGRTRNGLTFGAGWDFALTPNWAVGVEFNHYGFGSARYSEIIPGDDDPETFSVKSSVQSLTARLNYRFGN